MKVLLINGSPRNNGCCSRAIDEVVSALNSDGIDTEVINISNNDIRGCIACGSCKGSGKCCFNDIVNDVLPKFMEADGLVIASPVYYSGINGSLKSFLDRLFYSASFDKSMKVGACIVSSRRGGSTSVFDDINKYFTISSMPIVSSTYWNEVHGSCREDVECDLEGLQTMRNLGHNMAFLIKSISLGRSEFGIPKQERGTFTSFCDGK